MRNLVKLFSILVLFFFTVTQSQSAEKVDYLKTDWSFKGLFGKFDRGSLQRGYQVYTEVCASCHSMKYVSYRNLGEKGGPEFSEAEVKAIAASFELTDGPNADGEMFTRPAKPSDKFVMPYENVKAAQAANGGAYPPDMSVLVKARGGGVDYIYSLLQRTLVLLFHLGFCNLHISLNDTMHKPLYKLDTLFVMHPYQIFQINL